MANIAKFEQEQIALEQACKMAADTQLVANAASFFKASEIVQTIDQALSPEVIKAVAMPLMNRRCGFMTDRTGKPDKNGQVKPFYTELEVRDCIIDAITIGLLPVGNQFNILAGRMYPTKEGYTALLAKLGVKHTCFIGAPKPSDQGYITFPCVMTYYYEGEKVTKKFSADTILPAKSFDGIDQLRGKAERRFKKQFFEFLTGIDYGDADEESGQTIYQPTPSSVQHTDENKAKAAAVFGGGKNAEDAQVVGEHKPLTEEERKAAYQAELAKAKANMGMK